MNTVLKRWPPLPTALVVWVVYYNPRDYPGKYVVRPQSANADGSVSAYNLVYTGPTLDSVRCRIPRGRYCVMRDDSDEAAIVETWL